MSTSRDRYQTKTYSSTRDRGRDEHERQDLDLASYLFGRLVTAGSK